MTFDEWWKQCNYSEHHKEECRKAYNADEEFEKETAAFYMEIERERARISRNLLRYFGGNK